MFTAVDLLRLQTEAYFAVVDLLNLCSEAGLSDKGVLLVLDVPQPVGPFGEAIQEKSRQASSMCSA